MVSIYRLGNTMIRRSAMASTTTGGWLLSKNLLGTAIFGSHAQSITQQPLFLRSSQQSLHVLSSSGGAGSRNQLVHNNPQQQPIPPQQNLFVQIFGRGLQVQQQQVRFRWTKQKKKRYARYERRQKMKRLGIELPKPPMYMSKDTPVLNVLDKEVLEREIREHDERVAAEIRERLEKNKEPKLRFGFTGLQMSDRLRKLFLLHNGSQSEVAKAQKQNSMELFQRREGDTGSSAVQVVALTTRIQQLKTHMRKNKKDKSSKRGLDALTIRRRKVLDYMERKEFDSYRRVVKALGLSRR